MTTEPAPAPAQVQEPYVFLQWKGFEACFDFHCSCGAGNHVHAWCAYVVQCAACGTKWQLPTRLALTRAPDDETVNVVIQDDED